MNTRSFRVFELSRFRDKKPKIMASIIVLITFLSINIWASEGKQASILIDIRTKEQFEKFRIPGSINLPLYTIKTNLSLKSKPIVLVNEGYCYSQMEEECVRLKKEGFTVSILEGGLNAWKHRGGEIEGDLFAQREINKVSPQEFHLEKEAENYLVIDASDLKNPKANELISQLVRLPAPNKESLCSLGICGGNKNTKKQYRSILILTENGDGYERIEKNVDQAGLRNVFYLKDGLNGYKQFLNDLALSRVDRESRVKTVSKCAKCGEKNEKNAE